MDSSATLSRCRRLIRLYSNHAIAHSKHQIDETAHRNEREKSHKTDAETFSTKHIHKPRRTQFWNAWNEWRSHREYGIINAVSVYIYIHIYLFKLFVQQTTHPNEQEQLNTHNRCCIIWHVAARPDNTLEKIRAIGIAYKMHTTKNVRGVTKLHWKSTRLITTFSQWAKCLSKIHRINAVNFV